MNDDPRARFSTLLRQALDDGRLVKLTLGAATASGEEVPKNVHGRPVVVGGGPKLQLVSRYPRRDVTKNLSYDEALAWIDARLGPDFRHAHLFTPDASWQLELTPKPRLRGGPAAHAAPASTEHDRAKSRALTLDPRWAVPLGLLTADGRPIKGMEGKVRQIQRYVELVSHLLGEPGERPALRGVDLGCGKGYLTFALYQWLVEQGFAPTLVGVELRPGLVETTNRVARTVGYDGLSFRAGAIAEAGLEGAELVIALHACDTATDDALAAGVAAGARWLVAAPCCHKEVRKQLTPPPALAAVAAHGILREREAELVTDGLRAALLGAVGYEARVFEFVDSEHTAKNLMITAVRAERSPDPEPARALAAFYGVRRQRLAEALGIPLDGK